MNRQLHQKVFEFSRIQGLLTWLCRDAMIPATLLGMGYGSWGRGRESLPFWYL